MSEKREEIEEKIIVSKRAVIDLGGSKAVTLPASWLKIQKWLGKDVTEMISVANDVVILVPPEKENQAREILKQFEDERKKK